MLVFVVLTSAIIITILMVLLNRAKRNNKKILEQLRPVQENAVYEEIVCKIPPGSLSVSIDENVAYDRVQQEKECNIALTFLA